ncbi:MAG: hypothetical protein LKF31_01115 [Muribaculaceae bacterium]|nr:hypothetical protein [Muribaculaceae bacterium]
MRLISPEIAFPPLSTGISAIKESIEATGNFPAVGSVAPESEADALIFFVLFLMQHNRLQEALSQIDAAIEKLQSPSLAHAWILLAKAHILLENSNNTEAAAAAEESLRSLVAIENEVDDNFRAIAALALYNLAVAHFNTDDTKNADNELTRAQKIFERLAHSDRKRFSTALLITIDASTTIFKSNLKLMNTLAHYQVASDVYLTEASKGTADALSNLIDSLNNAGDIHLKMQNYRQAMRYFTKALRYHSKITEDFDLRSLRISIGLGNALLHIINRHAAGEQLLKSMLPVAKRLNAAAEESEINNLLNNMNTKSFDIKAFWKQIFVIAIIITSALSANSQLIIGHRGSIWGLENTYASFTNGIKNGADGLECDICTTADGLFVISHDSNTARLGGDTVKIAHLNAASVLTQPLHQVRDGKYYEGHLMSLGEYLDLCKQSGLTPVIEIKTCWNIYYSNKNPLHYCYDGVPALMQLIASKGMTDKVVIISFLAGVIDNIHTNYPNVHLQFLVEGDWKPYAKWCIDRNLDIDIEYNSVDADLVKTFHKAGLKVNAWTVDDPAALEKLQKLGVDMITTNKLMAPKPVIVASCGDGCK